MQSFNDLCDEVQRLRPELPSVLGVYYFSRSNPSSAHYVVCRSEQEFINLKLFHRAYDFTFTVLDC
jgi:hypothetical protein